MKFVWTQRPWLPSGFRIQVQPRGVCLVMGSPGRPCASLWEKCKSRQSTPIRMSTIGRAVLCVGNWIPWRCFHCSDSFPQSSIRKLPVTRSVVNALIALMKLPSKLSISNSTGIVSNVSVRPLSTFTVTLWQVPCKFPSNFVQVNKEIENFYSKMYTSNITGNNTSDVSEHNNNIHKFIEGLNIPQLSRRTRISRKGSDVRGTKRCSNILCRQ